MNESDIQNALAKSGLPTNPEELQTLCRALDKGYISHRRMARSLGVTLDDLDDALAVNGFERAVL